MPLYEGKLEKLSGMAGGTHPLRVRSFVDIGGRRINNVVLTPYRDELLQEALGEEVALSVYGRGRKRNPVVGIRTPKGGVHKDGLGGVIVSLFVGLFAALFFGLFVGGVVAGLGLAIAGPYGLAAGVAVFLAFVLAPFVGAVKSYRAWAAL